MNATNNYSFKYITLQNSILFKNRGVTVASGRAGQVGWAQTVSFPFNQRIFQFTSKAPSSKIRNLIFLLLKILPTLHADIEIQIEQLSFLVELPNLSIF
jgi:hypothetical protein